MSSITIAIADDYKVFRDGLKAILSADENIEVVLEADNGAELLEALAYISPDIILMDLKMPVMGGIEATNIVRQRYPQIKVLVISMYEDEKFITHLVKSGANGYLLKNTEPEDIRSAIYALTENGYFFNEPIENSLLKELILKNNLIPTFKEAIELTKTEKETLLRLCKDPLDKNITRSEKEYLMEKIGVRNTAGLVMYALVSGLAAD
ncbi:MAG: response regulator transcription factor [Chitinophagaceae bacterium]|nr:response regulator transcription factor [Chitinophagaceae bacterium]